MKIFFLGDIIGKLGRKTVGEILPGLKKKLSPDLVLANAENISHGAGANQKALEQVANYGVDYFTSGNHIWNKKEVYDLLNLTHTNIIRPANYPPGVPGEGYKIIKINQAKIALINLMGRVFIRELLDCPFRKFDEIYQKVQKEKLTAVIVDFHAEATSEKQAFAWYADGRATMVFGTHTHIPTADLRILPQGTGLVADAGMIGARDSVLGVQKDGIINKFLTSLPNRHIMIDKGPALFQSVLVEIKNKKVVKIERVDKEIN